jgi:hypothetical protein
MLLTDWYGLLTAADGYELRPAATDETLTAHEQQLQVRLPLQLRKLYLVSDGVFDRHGQWFVVWPLAELAGRNEPAWTGEGASRRELLAFGDDGMGAHFCVPRDCSPGVFLWQPLAAAPFWLANDVGDFWTGWTTGVITTYA